MIFGILILYSINGCRSTKKLQTAITKKDTDVVVASKAPAADSLKEGYNILRTLKKNRINFTTFSGKIKVQYEDFKGKQPDFNAFVRLYKDSVLWISINATFLSIEAFRILITKDSIIILNKLNKQVEYHQFKYIEEIASIPLDFSVLQDIIIGNPVYTGDSVVAYRRTVNHIIIGTIGKFFKNLITLAGDNDLIERSKLDDIDVGQNRGFSFPTYREITVAEKTKVDINLSYKQYEFNNELSFPFSIPRNYKTK
jgi:hypothetical protein